MHIVVKIPIVEKSKLEITEFINMTSEVFSDSYSRYYIISKKMYEILLMMQAKKLASEPIILI